MSVYRSVMIFNLSCAHRCFNMSLTPGQSSDLWLKHAETIAEPSAKFLEGGTF